MRTLVLFGAPGSGKGTQAKLLEALGFKQVSTGDLLRHEISIESALGLTCKKLMDSGQYVPDSIVCELIENVLKQSIQEGKTGIIFDGFPRTKDQANFLVDLLDRNKVSLPSVVHLQVSNDLLLKRFEGRIICRSCGAIYNKYFSPQKVEGVCDYCKGEDFYQRLDDHPDVVQDRLNKYENETSSLIELFKEKGLSVFHLNAEKKVNDVFTEIKNCIGLN